MEVSDFSLVDFERITFILAYTLGALIIAITVSAVVSWRSSFANISAVSLSYQNCESFQVRIFMKRWKPANPQGTSLLNPLPAEWLI